MIQGAESQNSTASFFSIPVNETTQHPHTTFMNKMYIMNSDSETEFPLSL